LPAVVKINDQKVSDSGKTSLPESVRAVTHDLRTPLTSVKSSLNLVLRGEAGQITPDQRHFLDMAMRNIDRLDRMIAGMLTAARSRDEALEVKCREVDLGPILKDAAESHRVTASNRGLEIDDSGLPDSFCAQVDPDLVVRMLDNVVGNRKAGQALRSSIGHLQYYRRRQRSRGERLGSKPDLRAVQPGIRP